MNYNTAFISKATELFPLWSNLHKAIHSGLDHPVRIMLETVHTSFSPYEVHNAINNGMINELNNKAIDMIQAQSLLSDWYEMYHATTEEIKDNKYELEITEFERKLFGDIDGVGL